MAELENRNGFKTLPELLLQVPELRQSKFTPFELRFQKKQKNNREIEPEKALNSPTLLKRYQSNLHECIRIFKHSISTTFDIR